MKKKEEQSFKRQIVSGLVYTALAVTVTAAAVGGITSSFGKAIGKAAPNVTVSPSASDGNTAKASPRSDETQSVPVPHVLPDAASFSLDTPLESTADTHETAPVTDIEQGVDAAISSVQTVPERVTPTVPTPTVSPEPVMSDVTRVDRSVPVSEEPVEEYAGYGGYIRPCGGYVSREYAPDAPIYSPTMLDFRTHDGVDLACDIGTPVRAAAAGVIRDIYEDALYGTTMAIAHEDGVVSVYANLSPDLPAGIEEGVRVIAGDVIAGVGESAACESAEVSHLHFELWRDAKPVDPASFFP